ncbi:MAG: diphthine--ammonia ligase, partial [Leeuwenhoekiella sp.]
MKKAFFNWSSGKDSALALYKVLQEKEFDVSQLLTTINSDVNRVSMHGLRVELLDLQAESLGIPLVKIELKGTVSMSEYSQIMEEAANKMINLGCSHSIFGDIFLEDLREYREKELKNRGIRAVFPLWQQDTKKLMHTFIELGFKAITVCVNAKVLDESFVGRLLDEAFLADLPDNIDPCGENGEFHTFVFDGPIFNKSINFHVGEKVIGNYDPNEDDEENCFSDI